ncbi:MAG: T9SS type A sorting domain-containing protein [Bacteroidales bacterium]|nr:T9SS type A sorting domain-containing protein [Bacteroidales bacterium]
MKKTLLMFVGLAMCSTIAFGQANNYNANPKVNAKDLHKMAVTTKFEEPNVDYKASIFAKDDMDTIKTWTFDGTTDNMPTVYGANGRVVSGMMVGGQELPANGSSNAATYWNYIPDSSFFTSSDYDANAFALGNYIEDILEDMDGGFMLNSYMGTNMGEGRPHAFMEFAPIDRPADAAVIMVAFKQSTAKFYNQYFIDYQIAGQWYSFEFNINGVDARINYWCAVNRNYTLPLALAGENQIKIRVRSLGSADGHAAYGYFWGLDDLSIISGPADNWKGHSADYVDGFYGTMPQGMNIPIAWMAQLNNTGSNPRTNISAIASHSFNGTVTNFATHADTTLPAGDPAHDQPIILNERGAILPDSLAQAGWFDYSASGFYGTTGLPSGYTGHGLPTANLGQNKFQAMVASTGIDTMKFTAVNYRVVGNTNSPVNSELLTGYRWAHDNGIIASGVDLSASFTIGLVQEGDQYYVVDSGHYGDPGYLVVLRYNTPSVVPTDGNGQPWVLRGIELVTSSEFEESEVDGVQLAPIVWTDQYEEGGNVSFNNVNTGVNGQLFEFEGSALSNESQTGITVADENGEYHAASFFFPEQPELTPNTSFRLGFQVYNAAHFAVAGTTNRTVVEDGEGNLMWQSIDSLAPGYAQNFALNYYDLLVRDPIRNGLIWMADHTTQIPMIRAIVGPKVDLPTHSIFVQCDDKASVQYVDVEKCGDEVLVAQGSAPTFYFYAADSHYVLKQLTIDGNVIVPATEDDINGDPNFYTEGDDNLVIDGYEYPLLERNFWTYTFESDDTTAHTISITTEYAEWAFNDIDPVAANVTMLLAPNPATSQVAMTLKGVTGMVNCNIIDMSGRVVYNNVLNAERSNSIDLSNVPAGAYFVRISNDSFVKVEKLIVR